MMVVRTFFIILISCLIYIVIDGRPISVVQKTARKQGQEFFDASLKEDLQNLTSAVKQVAEEVQTAVHVAIDDDREIIETAVDNAAREKARIDYAILYDKNHPPVDTQLLLQYPTINPPVHISSSTENETIFSNTITASPIPPSSVPSITDSPSTYSTRTTLPLESFIRTISSPRVPTTTFPSTSFFTRKTTSTYPSVISTTKKCNRLSPSTGMTIRDYSKQKNPTEVSIVIEGSSYKSWLDWKTQDFLISFKLAMANNNSSAMLEPAQNSKPSS